VGQDLSPENDVHVEGGLVLSEDEGSVGAYALCAVGGEPRVLGLGEAVERGDGAEGRDDLGQWRGFRRRGGDDRGADRRGAGEIEEVEAGLSGDFVPPLLPGMD